MRNFRLIEHFLLRRAGFPFRLMEPLEAPGSVTWAERVVLHEAEAARLRHQLLTEILSREVMSCANQGDRVRLRSLSRLRRDIGYDRQPREHDITLNLSSETLGPTLAAWLASQEKAKDARETLERHVQHEYKAARSYLYELLTRQDILEALFLLSPGFFETASRWREHTLLENSSAKERAFDQRFLLFLQRLAAKNETTSFFGPLTYGVIDRSIDHWIFGPEVQTGVLRRETFAAFWAVAALSHAVCRDERLRRLLPIRRLGIASVCEGKAQTVTGTTVELDARSVEVFEALKRPATVADLATNCTLSIEECERTVSKLERLGLIRRDLEPLSTVSQPLFEVRERLPQGEAGDRWRQIFDELISMLQVFSIARLPERQRLLSRIEATFQEVTGKPPRRNAGKMYADRLVVYEDCLGDMHPLRCPAAEANRIERELAPILRLGAAYGELRYRAVRTLASHVLEKLGSPAPFLAFAEAIDSQAARRELQALLQPATDFLERLQQLVAAHSDGGVAYVDARTIDQLIECEPGARAVSLDLMFERRTGKTPQIILGEAHPYVFAWGSQAHFAPDKSALQAAFAQDLLPWGGKEHMATVLRRRQHKGLVSNDFPGRFIEISAMSDASQGRSIAIADVMVVASEKGPILQSPEGEELILYVGENDHLHLRAFALPQVEMPLVRCGNHTPRIQIEDVVYQRQRWEYATGTLPRVLAAESSGDLAVEIARLRKMFDWPRFLFAKSEAEPKPVCLDLNILLAQATLKKLLRLGSLTLVEMLPRPHALWLERSNGLYTSELRVQFVV